MARFILIPPKTLAEYVAKAKDGKAARYVGDDIALFYNNKQEIVVFAYSGPHPSGHARQMTDREFAARNAV